MTTFLSRCPDCGAVTETTTRWSAPPVCRTPGCAGRPEAVRGVVCYGPDGSEDD
ncbi:MAG TPA: hypothetical protein VHL53_07160 [Acidimicrobiia bacterium]|nr:hypothetical protein [Acidimicrobiia bacterium]